MYDEGIDTIRGLPSELLLFATTLLPCQTLIFLFLIIIICCLSGGMMSFLVKGGIFKAVVLD